MYRSFFEIPPLQRYLESFAFIFLILALYFYAKNTFSRCLILIFFISSTLVNNIHQAVYLNWINGTNYFLMIKEYSEVLHAGTAMISDGKLTLNIIWSLFDIVLFYFLGRNKQKRYWQADLLFYSLFIFIFIRSFYSNQEFGITAKASYSRIKVNYFALGNAIGKVLPYEIFQLSDVAKYSKETPEQIAAPLVKNIILIQGESVTSKHMSVFGYSRQTTPFLETLNDNSTKVLLKEAYSGGLYTAISLPSFFNIIPKPNGLEQIITGKTNLFNLAQKAKFNTIFYSSQPETEMAIINLIGQAWIDDLRFPTKLGYDFTRGMNDHLLLPWFEEISLNKSANFIVLHQRGSHQIYAEYLNDEEKVFKQNTDLDNYDSTIHNTDLLIKKVINHLESQGNKDWVLIYTSDHGQFVTDKHANQGTNEESNYLVPILIYSPNEKVQALTNKFQHCQRMFHQQLSTFIGQLLGYDIPLADCQKGYINGQLLTGDAGYYEVKINQPPQFIK